MWQDKNVKKRRLEGKSCQEGSWQENCLDG